MAVQTPRGPYRRYLMATTGDKAIAGKKIAVIYSRCASELYARAELLRLVSDPKTADKMINHIVVGSYHVDPAYSVDEFLESYEDPEKRKAFEECIKLIRESGWDFEEVSGEPRDDDMLAYLPVDDKHVSRSARKQQDVNWRRRLDKAKRKRKGGK